MFRRLTFQLNLQNSEVGLSLTRVFIETVLNWVGHQATRQLLAILALLIGEALSCRYGDNAEVHLWVCGGWKEKFEDCNKRACEGR